MNSDYIRIEQAIRFIQLHAGRQPGLAEVAAHVGLSPYHFQRLFRRWAGISPKRYLEILTVDLAKALLNRSHSVLDAAHAVGLSGPSRLHEQFISVEAVTPGEFKRGGQGLDIDYAIAPGPFGTMLLARTERGLCFLAFADDANRVRELDRLRRLYPRATLNRDDDAAAVADGIFQKPYSPQEKFHLLVRGTNFQVNVWRALLRIPWGATVSYSQLAGHLGSPAATRAVANAVAANPVHYLIPCHRVLRADGVTGGYRGGAERKKMILAWEAAALESDAGDGP
jgi:AraC family transcriptional regulator of adaptative response/methylated-DNA-[protein]-cysteine methyltransferase